MSVFQKVTLKTLKENKTRTIVTIIGILLSLSMFTAVTVSVSSFRNFMLDIAIQREGNWHGTVMADSAVREDISSDKAVEKVTFLEVIGYAHLSDNVNPDKPYLFVSGLDENADGILPLNVTEGRLPENDGELLIPEHLSYNGGVYYNVGDTVTLNIGERLSLDAEGNLYALKQNTPYLYTEEELKKQGLSPEQIADKDTEQFVPRFERTYTVVGIYQRPSIEPYSAPGYTALTVSSNGAAAGNTASGTTEDGIGSFQAYIRFHNPKDAMPWLEQHYPAPAYSETNSDLLRMYAASYESSYNAVLYQMASVLIFIIMFGSISLIYNAFSISVTERTKQFGLLSSLGATRRQLVRSVLFEGVSLCAIGIPLGILAGIAGIGITFAFLGPAFSESLYGASAVPLTLHVSPLSVVGAGVIGLFTVLISAWLPARRATKLSPIEAIRQTTDIAIRPGKVRTSKLTYKLFGLSGMLASKNFKRNRKKYRATVVSLFVSVVLFISASSFCSYLTKAAGDIVSDSGCDIVYRHRSDEATTLSNDEILHAFSELDSVTQVAWNQYEFSMIYLDEEALSQEYLDFWASLSPEEAFAERNSKGQRQIHVEFYFIDNATYGDYLDSQGLSREEYMNPENPVAVAFDLQRIYSGDTGKYTTFHLFASAPIEGIHPIPTPPEGYSYNGWHVDDEGKPVFSYYNEITDEFLEEKEDEWRTEPVRIGAVVDELPFFVGDVSYYNLALLYPASAMETVLGVDGAENTQNYYSSFLFTTDNHKAAAADISETLRSLGLNHNSVFNYAENAAQERTMLLIINVFSYGFIILISLIAMANVFNTISTNIQLRKREFAMLKSTGMTPKGFRVMMCYECLLYGAKGLLYGLPVSIAITWWIYRGIAHGWDTHFYVPWYSLVIAIGSVFLIVGSTMVYSMQKIKKDNVVDALKDDNA